MSPSAEPVPAVALLDVSEAVLELLLELALRDADADEVTPPLGTTPGWNTDRISWFREFHRASAAGLDGPAGQKSWAISCDGQLAGSVRLRRPDTEPPEAVAGGAGATADAGAGTGGGVGTGATADAGAGTGGGVGTGATADAGAGAGAGATADAGAGAGAGATADAGAGAGAGATADAGAGAGAGATADAGVGGVGGVGGGADADADAGIGGVALETGIWLARSFRGRGVGREALRLVKARAASAGAAFLVAETTAGNAAALALLTSAGAELVTGAASETETVPVKGKIPLH